MPPKKKPRLSTRATPLQDSQPSTTATPTDTDTPNKRQLPSVDSPADPWSDEQEIALFKGVIRWKPAGLHKHFRMLAISQQVKAAPRSFQHEAHTTIPGIWRKLQSLYNLDAINERENSFLEPDEDLKEPADEPYHPFFLPDAEYGEAMFARRLAKNGSSSPSLLDQPAASAPKRGRKPGRGALGPTRASTVEDTEEEAASSPAPATSTKSTRSTRTAKATPKAEKPATSKRTTSARRSKAASVAETEEEATGEEAEDEGEDSEEEDEGQDDDGAEDQEAETPAPRNTRGAPKAGKDTGKAKRSAGKTETRRSTRKR
ncbi:MAG: hypothetical protein M1833_007377 [Piccolia ochrophora]|nr:MAG: hypothetical protein M1833_007377 [Piccolia ochrophora]